MSAARDLRIIQPADILLVSRKWQGIRDLLPHRFISYGISRRIQRVTGSPYNHCGLLLPDDTGGIGGCRVIEALDAVKVTPLARYLDERKYRIKILRYEFLAPGRGERIVDWAMRQAGERYNYRLLLQMRLMLLLNGLSGLKGFIEHSGTDRKVWICSELVQSAYFSQGVQFAGRLLTPGDFEYVRGMREVKL